MLRKYVFTPEPCGVCHGFILQRFLTQILYPAGKAIMINNLQFSPLIDHNKEFVCGLQICNLKLSYCIFKYTWQKVYHYSYCIDEETKTREIRFAQSDITIRCTLSPPTSFTFLFIMNLYIISHHSLNFPQIHS